jgi:hypothetical protein
MSNGTPKRQRDQPESDADRSRDLDKLNQQVVYSDLFGGAGREEDFQPASPEVERFSEWRATRSEIRRHLSCQTYKITTRTCGTHYDKREAVKSFSDNSTRNRPPVNLTVARNQDLWSEAKLHSKTEIPYEAPLKTSGTQQLSSAGPRP